jgi:4-aminobutyrate aminotransferase/(S)-3-amino-2-methylpropionate transaminase
MRERDLNAQARRIEETVVGRLKAVAEKTDIIAEIRGRGAMIAIEFTERTPEVAARVAKACHDQGVVVLTCGTYGNVIRLLPPLVIPDDLLAEGLDVLEAALLA